MIEDEIQVLLYDWQTERNLPLPVVFKGYTPLGGSTMGRCTNYRDRSEIRLSDRWQGHGLGWLVESVLWHEMAHAIAYQEDMKGNGHDARWRELRDSNRHYMIGDWVAKLVFPFIRRRGE